MSFWDSKPDEPQGPLEAIPPSEVVIARPPPELTKPPALYAFFAKQGLEPEHVDAFGCGVSKHEFSSGLKPAIVFPFRSADGHGVLGYGYRPPEGGRHEYDQGAAGALFNLDGIETHDELWWAADELEAMALVSAGFRQTVAAPCDLDTALRDHADVLEQFKRITLALPTTDDGNRLLDALAARLGRDRVWTVTWPDGCQSACDTARQRGLEKLTDTVNAALPWPIEGVQYVRPGTLKELRRRPTPPVLTTGTRATDRILRFPGEGKLILITGIPGHGKSTWAKYVTVHTAKDHDRRWLWFSPEHAPWEKFAAELAEVYVGRPFYRRRLANNTTVPAMDDTELEMAEHWLASRIQMLVADSQDEAPNLDWIFDRAKRCILRDGVTDIGIDPWNELEHTRPERMSETEYVGNCLQRIKGFIARHGVNFWIVAHPKSQQPAKPGGKLAPPGMYDISGGANWSNKADLGLCVHTPDNEFTQIHVLKSKYRRWGVRNTKALITLDPASNRYYTEDGQLAMDTASIERDE